jgi:hypothetical protein
VLGDTYDLSHVRGARCQPFHLLQGVALQSRCQVDGLSYSSRCPRQSFAIVRTRGCSTVEVSVSKPAVLS